MERVCQHCGASLEGRRSGTAFCTKRCAAASYRIRFPEKVKEANACGYRKNCEERKRKQQEWNLANADHRRERDKAYYQKNRDHCVERQRKWNAENADYANDYQRKKRMAEIDRYRARDRAFNRTRAAKAHMQEVLTAMPILMDLIKQAQEQDK